MCRVAVTCIFLSPCMVEALKKELEVVLQPSGGDIADMGHRDEKRTFQREVKL